MAVPAVAVLCVLCGLASPVRACGFDGVFDGSFGVPDARSIEVAVAVRRAAEDGMLPGALEPIAPGAAGLWRAADRMHALQRRLSAIAASTSSSVTPMAVLFIGSGLWTRFVPTAGAYSSQIHASKAEPEDITIVSDEAVFAEILGGRLSARLAFDRGLIVVDAPASIQQRVRDLLITAFEVILPAEASTDLVSARTPWRNLAR